MDVATHDIPRAGGLPILGASIPLLRDPLTYLRQKHAELGPVFSVNAAHRSFVVLAGAKANRFVAVEGRDAFQARSFWGPLGEEWKSRNFMIAIDGPDHMWLRKAYRNDVSRGVVQGGAEGASDLIIGETDRAADAGEIVVRDLCRLLVSRQVHHLLTGGAAPVDEDTVNALLEVFRWETNALLLGKWPRAALWAPSYRRHVDVARSFIRDLIKETEREQPESGWLATTMAARARRPDLMTQGDVELTFLLPFIAGVDTVGSTLSFLLYELMRRTDVRRAVVGAVDRMFDAHGGIPPIDVLRGDDDLRGVVLETLRLYPAAFAIYRTTTRDVEFEGCTIPEGTDVVVFTSGSHTDPVYFEDPYRFDIERFREPRLEHKKKFVFAPYGGGPHVCLGAGMGEALVVLTTAVLLRNFEFMASGTLRELRHDYDPSLVAPSHFRVRARRRSPS